MTTTHIDEVEHRLQAKGLRRTGARRKILEAVFEGDGHFTAEDLLDRMRESGVRVSRASVYRTLSLLVDGGWVETREFQRGQLRYECMHGHRHHDHLICTKCGRVVEFENDEIERLQIEAAKSHGFVLESHSLRLFGRCASCSA
jgi:Fur family transcriptional regulator, ferric uptake regulator